MNKNKYTQRQWDRTVGWGSVPKEYSILESEVKDEQEDSSVDEDTDD
jgi:hypothetical protein